MSSFRPAPIAGQQRPSSGHTLYLLLVWQILAVSLPSGQVLALLLSYLLKRTVCWGLQPEMVCIHSALLVVMSQSTLQFSFCHLPVHVWAALLHENCTVSGILHHGKTGRDPLQPPLEKVASPPFHFDTLHIETHTWIKAFQLFARREPGISLIFSLYIKVYDAAQHIFSFGRVALAKECFNINLTSLVKLSNRTTSSVLDSGALKGPATNCESRVNYTHSKYWHTSG